MIELIAIVIFFGSILGMGIILFRKIPVLVKLPAKAEKINDPFFYNLTNKVKLFGPIKNISLENALRKILSRFSILILKTENKISGLIQKSRERDRKKKEIEGDNYWRDLKKSTKRKK